MTVCETSKYCDWFDITVFSKSPKHLVGMPLPPYIIWRWERYGTALYQVTEYIVAERPKTAKRIFFSRQKLCRWLRWSWLTSSTIRPYMNLRTNSSLYILFLEFLLLRSICQPIEIFLITVTVVSQVLCLTRSVDNLSRLLQENCNCCCSSDAVGRVRTWPVPKSHCLVHAPRL